MRRILSILALLLVVGMANAKPVTITTTANVGYAFAGWSNGVRINLYTFLAHDVSIQAIFVDTPASLGDTLAYLGVTDQKGVLFINSNFCAGTRFPPEMLQGRDSITGIEIIGPSCTYIFRIFHGGDTAPGRLLYEQSYTVEDGFETWHHAELDQNQPIAQDSSLWITVQLLESAFFVDTKNTSIPDDNRLSTDSGDSWIHLTDYETTNPIDDLTLLWFVRCITYSNSTGTSELLTQSPELLYIPTTHLELSVSNFLIPMEYSMFMMPRVDLSSVSTRTPRPLALMLVGSRRGSIYSVSPLPKALALHGCLSNKIFSKIA